MADGDLAASFIEYGRLASHPPGDFSETYLMVKLTAALRSLFKARYVASEGSMDSVVAWFLVLPPCDTEEMAQERAFLVGKGAASALANGANLQAGMKNLRLPAHQEATFGWEVRGLLVACVICMGFVPTGHLRMFEELQAIGATMEDLEYCFNLQEDLKREVRFQAPAHKLFLCVIWSCHHTIEADDNNTRTSHALQLLVQSNTMHEHDQNLQAVVRELHDKEALVKFAEYCSSGGDPSSCASGRNRLPAANSIGRSTGITNLFGDGLQVGARPPAAKSTLNVTGITNLFSEGLQVDPRSADKQVAGVDESA